jgi:hypothetical protein
MGQERPRLKINQTIWSVHHRTIFIERVEQFRHVKLSNHRVHALANVIDILHIDLAKAWHAFISFLDARVRSQLDISQLFRGKLVWIERLQNATHHKVMQIGMV